MAKIRLDKLLSAAAGLSRTEARDALKAGRVTVDGARLTDGSCKVEESSQLLLDGASVTYRANHYLMMNKPAGYISATEDPREKTVLLLLPPEGLAQFPGVVFLEGPVGVLQVPFQKSHHAHSSSSNIFSQPSQMSSQVCRKSPVYQGSATSRSSSGRHFSCHCPGNSRCSHRALLPSM